MSVFGVWLCLVDGASVVQSKSGFISHWDSKTRGGKKKEKGKKWNLLPLCPCRARR